MLQPLADPADTAEQQTQLSETDTVSGLHAAQAVNLWVAGVRTSVATPYCWIRKIARNSSTLIVCQRQNSEISGNYGFFFIAVRTMLKHYSFRISPAIGGPACLQGILCGPG